MKKAVILSILVVFAVFALGSVAGAAVPQTTGISVVGTWNGSVRTIQNCNLSNVSLVVTAQSCLNIKITGGTVTLGSTTYTITQGRMDGTYITIYATSGASSYIYLSGSLLWAPGPKILISYMYTDTISSSDFGDLILTKTTP